MTIGSPLRRGRWAYLPDETGEATFAPPRPRGLSGPITGANMGSSIEVYRLTQADLNRGGAESQRFGRIPAAATQSDAEFKVLGQGLRGQ